MGRDDRRKALHADLLRIGRECRDFGYNPARFLQDVANSPDPIELVYRYVTGLPTDGFERLHAERRLDLSVENAAWRFRDLFTRDVVDMATNRLSDAGFDVRSQKMAQ